MNQAKLLQEIRKMSFEDGHEGIIVNNFHCHVKGNLTRM